MNWKIRLGIVVSALWLFLAALMVDASSIGEFQWVGFLYLSSPVAIAWGIWWVWDGFRNRGRKDAAP
jgi:hypothetical protein